MNRKRIVIGLAIVVAVIGIGALEWSADWRGWFGIAKPTNVLVVSGNIEAHKSVLAFKTVESRIDSLPFDEGKWVKSGTVIAQLDDADYRQQVVIAEAALEIQKRQLAVAQQNQIAVQKTVASDNADLEMKRLDYERYDMLWQRGNATTQARDLAATGLKQSRAALERDQALVLTAQRNIELAMANIASAEASVEMAKIVSGYTTLVAPFDGVIVVRQAELGEIAMPGTPVVTIADLDHVWLRAYINETDIGRFHFGARAEVSTDSLPGKIFTGHISFIASDAEFTPKTVETHAERVTLVYRIKIDIDNPDHELVPGLPADASIALSSP
jgi:HlyD family secretion protein